MRVAGIGIWASVAVTLVCGESGIAQLRINELMHSPSGGEPEWIELYNSGSDRVDIKSWTINNKNRVRYVISDSSFYVGSHSYLVLTKSNGFAGFHPEAAGSYLVVNWSQYFLVNSGDTVSLHDAAGRLVDSVYYASSWGGSGGKSLERRLAADSSRAQSNWGTSLDPSGSTPGRMNSITPKAYDLSVSSFDAAFMAGQSKAVFDLWVKNKGYLRAASFSVNVFVDYNGDSTAQPEELVTTVSMTTLNSGDSVRFQEEHEIGRIMHANAIAVVVFDSDEDVANNRAVSGMDLSYASGTVVVNEIMYAPPSPQPEWIELYNASTDSVVIDGFTVGDNSGTRAHLPERDFVVAPGGYAVVADDSSFFEYHPDLTDVVIVVAIPSLNNSGDAVIVRDASDRTMDSVAYSPSWGGNSGGKSLERILPGGSSNDPRNFETCIDSAKSTPGRINSVTPLDNDLTVGIISWSPASIQSGEQATIAVNVLNAGLRPSGRSTAILFDDANNDLGIDPGERRDSAEVASIAAGDSTTATLKSGILSFGSHRFGVVIEYPADERKGNNSKSIVLGVGLPPAAIAINEIMYAPKNESEWIELYNTSPGIVDLSDFRFVSRGSSSKIKSGALIAPGGFVVFSRDSSVERLHGNVPELVVQSIPSLNNNGGGVGLYDNLGNLLDTMDYRPSFGGDTGRSLERIDFLAGNDSTNWAESVDITGATPGRENSVAILPVDAAMKRLDLSAAPTVPGKAGVISLVLVNRGKNTAANIGAKIEIVRGLDSTTVFSETKPVPGSPGRSDSASVQFNFSPERSGSYFVFGSVSLKDDPRRWNDTLSAKLEVGFDPQSVVINEIMFTKGPMGEYFEIYNESQSPIDLTDWAFHTNSSSLKPISQSINPSFQHSILPPTLLPGGYCVVASDSSILDAVTDTAAVGIVKPLTLRDDGDCIVIVDPSGNVVDSVCYLPSWHNPDIARTAGRSLEKINPNLPSNEKTSWSTSVSQSGGTPGARNSLFVSPGQSAGSISVSPNPFSPDGDGHDDFTFVSYSFPVTSVKIRMRIFDTVGRLIATPADNVVLPSTGKLVWDGRDGSGKIVRFGLYILFVEVTGPRGNSLAIYKRPLVVAKRMR